MFESEAVSAQTTAMTQTEETALPTESRIKQKERLKAEKEAGIKPRQPSKHIKDGNDDCGEDLSGLGKDISSCLGGATPEDLEGSDDEDESLFMPFSQPSSRTRADVFSIIQALC